MVPIHAASNPPITLPQLGYRCVEPCSHSAESKLVKPYWVLTEGLANAVGQPVSPSHLLFFVLLGCSGVISRIEPGSAACNVHALHHCAIALVPLSSFY